MRAFYFLFLVMFISSFPLSCRADEDPFAFEEDTLNPPRLTKENTPFDFELEDLEIKNDPCDEYLPITQNNKKMYELGTNPDFEEQCKQYLLKTHAEYRESLVTMKNWKNAQKETGNDTASYPYSFSFKTSRKYTITLYIPMIDFYIMYINRDNKTFAGIYIGNHANFPLEKLSPENTFKNIKDENKTIVEEYSGKTLVRKQVKIETGNGFPAEIAAWTNDDLNAKEFKEAISILNSLDQQTFREQPQIIPLWISVTFRIASVYSNAAL